jgi:hypothetical protein
MAEHLDYVSAMVYPSHWAPGEYGVANPNAQPYDIVQRSLQDFQKDVRGTARASSRGSRTSRSASTYGPRRSARRSRPRSDDGIDEYLLWDPLVTYTAAALPADARTPCSRSRRRRRAGAKT